MKLYKSPDRDNGRYGKWLNENYDTNYWRFRPIWFPKNKFNLWDITYGSEAYEKQDIRSTINRWEPWEDDRAFSTLTTYFLEIRKSYSKKKMKKNKSVYKPFRG